MFCPNCGTKLPDGAVFCSNCGTKVQVAPAAPVVEPVVEPVTEPVTAQPVAEPVAEPVTAQPVAEPEQPAFEEAPVFEEIPQFQQAPEFQQAPVFEEAPAEPAAPAQAAPEQAPADYMTINIILCVASVLTCCGCVSVASIVTSIIGIVAGSACKKAVEAGDWATAEAKSKTAKTMWIVSAVIVGVSILAAIVLMLTGVVAGMIENL